MPFPAPKPRPFLASVPKHRRIPLCPSGSGNPTQSTNMLSQVHLAPTWGWRSSQYKGLVLSCRARPRFCSQAAISQEPPAPAGFWVWWSASLIQQPHFFQVGRHARSTDFCSSDCCQGSPEGCKEAWRPGHTHTHRVNSKRDQRCYQAVIPVIH